MASKVFSVLVLLKLPIPVPKLIVRANAIVTAVGNAKGTYFPSPSPALASVTTHVGTLATCESNLKSRVNGGTVAVRDAARKAVIIDLKQLRSYVTQIADADPDHASVIADAAAMYIRTQTHPEKPPLAVKHLAIGVVQVIAKATLGGKANDWQYSTDGGKTWISVPSTTKAKTVITGLQSGVTTMFRQRALTKNGVQDWGQPISAMVT
jgi:hypothetical protein